MHQPAWNVVKTLLETVNQNHNTDLCLNQGNKQMNTEDENRLINFQAQVSAQACVTLVVRCHCPFKIFALVRFEQ